MAKIRKVLVANRGEIALRVMRTCKELGISTVAVFSEADRSALFVRCADEAYCVGPAASRESYLRQDVILDVAKRSGADAIHPGYGFLSENASFVRACEKAGVTFIGPPASAMDAMGEKTRARANMIKAGVPVVPGTDALSSVDEARAFAQKVDFPVMLKAAGGGGGKGMRKVEDPKEFDSAWRSAKSEAMGAFGNDAVYIEKFLDKPHHVEIQVFGDTHGNVIHLNERECSAQRRHQKVVEETPSPILTPKMRAEMGEVAVRAARAVNYVGAGTVEFLVDSARKFYFLEMNTRLQVEHPVTEWVTGVDLVRWQIQIAEGAKLPLLQAPTPNGHSIEVRVYAEDPAQNFMPSPGRITALHTPSGPNIRDDSGVYAGYEVPRFYDPMISKLSVWAPTRAEAIERMKRALSEYMVKGITTNVRYLSAIMDNPEFRGGDYDTGFLPRQHQALLGRENEHLTELSVIAAAVYAHTQDEKRKAALPAAAASTAPSRWRSFSVAGRRT
ncbi:MAG: acetyl-CoA carboxylase biotin carboxylase subunit [Deltaproteobacteria bacterium]|nr:acetyl-CoA carboxylase biotin carboxylase subunit [Deltaproteobacteria bacterium]